MSLYEKSKSYDQLTNAFDEVEKALKAHTGPLPSRTKPTERAKRSSEQASPDVLEEGALSCFAED